MTMYLRYAARSDRGLVRHNNQDSVFAGPRLLAVADGMGGHVGGEVASKIVIAAIEYLDEDDPGGDMLQALREGVEASTQHLREVVDEHEELDGMGTTLTALLFNGKRIGVCHVGDSRAYVFRNDALHQITHDDTFVQALIDEGRITPEEASVHPQRSVILRALNGADVDPALSMREGRAGDRYLLCSDGLSSFVSAERIEKVLRTSEAPAEAADSLIDFALRAGGPDNVTVIVADLLDDDATDSFDGEPVVDGAAGGNRGQRESRGDSPAARAALIGKRDEPAAAESAADPSDTDEGDTVQRPRRKRRWWVLLGVLLVLVAGGFAAKAYLDSRYFVGVDGEDVVIYNGVDTEIGPVALYSVAERTDFRISDLQSATRLDIQNGVEASSLKDARDIVGRLKDRLLPLCDPGTGSSGDTGQAPGGTDPSATTTPDPNATPSTDPGATTAPDPGATPSADPNASASAPSSSAATSSAAGEPDGAEPTCRTER